MPAPATHDFVHLEISSASVLNTSVNGPLNYLIGRDLGSDDSIELEDSLEILSSSGDRYLRLPQGTTGQRPTGKAGMLRLNTTAGQIDSHDGVNWGQLLTSTSVTFETLDTNGDVGNSSTQVAVGDHGHELIAEVLGVSIRDADQDSQFSSRSRTFPVGAQYLLMGIADASPIGISTFTVELKVDGVSVAITTGVDVVSSSHMFEGDGIEHDYRVEINRNPSIFDGPWNYAYSILRFL